MATMSDKHSMQKGSTYRVPIREISAIVPPMFEPMGLVLCMRFETALQLWSYSSCKFIYLALCICQLGLRVRDGNEGVFEALERGYKRQNGKFGKCGLSGKGCGARRGTRSGGLPIGGPGGGWVDWHGEVS
jgi:hypothetical protein